MPTVLRPLTSGLTYRRWVHLLLSGVLALPYALLIGIFVTGTRRPGADTVSLAVLAVLAVVLAVLIALVPAVRVLEVDAARTLLGVRLPDPALDEIGRWAVRWRSAGWLAANLVLGATMTVAVLIVLPTAVPLAARPFSEPRPLDFGGVRSWDAPTGWAAAWLPVVAIAGVLVVLYAGAGVGALLARWAPVLLGPAPATELARARREVERLTERTRLARELHDSVGHALTVTTLQAGAAARVLDTDPEFARRALAAISDVGRAALDELDQVLGVLRDGDAAVRPQRTLADLDALLYPVRGSAVEVRTEVDGDLACVPPAVSREAYRIAQEGLTNALRHAAGGPVVIRVVAGPDRVELELTNPVGRRPAGRRHSGPGGGRGLPGMRERVAALGGAMSAGSEAGIWRLTAQLPTRSGR